MLRDNKSGCILTAQSVTWVGLAANILLAALKIAAGLLCRSMTILTDGLHSASDATTDIAVLASLKVSEKPADSCHRYGHRRVGTLVAMFIGATLFGVAGWIAYDAVLELRLASDPLKGVTGFLPLYLAIASVPVKEVLFHLTRRVGKREANISIMANAWHHRTDSLSSVAAAIGLAGVALGGRDWWFLDHLTAIILAAFLVVVAVRIIISAGSELVDRAPGQSTLSAIEKVLADTHGVKGYHAFRARHTGGKVEMDVHVQVDGTLTVAEGHRIASEVRNRIKQADSNVVQVIVHIEPNQPE